MQLSYLLPAPLEHKTNVEKEDEIICLKKKKKSLFGNRCAEQCGQRFLFHGRFALFSLCCCLKKKQQQQKKNFLLNIKRGSAPLPHRSSSLLIRNNLVLAPDGFSAIVKTLKSAPVVKTIERILGDVTSVQPQSQVLLFP